MPRQAAYDREAVLEKARSLFWEKGFRGTSLKDLEETLDMRPGSIYAAFGSKEDLFVEALRLYGQRSGEAFRTLIAEADSPLEGIAEHIRNFVRRSPEEAPSRACMLVKTVLETPDDDPVLRREAEALMQATELLFTQAFQKAKSAGDIAPDADEQRLAQRLQTNLFGLGAFAQRTDAHDRVLTVAEDIVAELRSLRPDNAG